MDISLPQPKESRCQAPHDDRYESKCFHGFSKQSKPSAHMFEFKNKIGSGMCAQVYREKCVTERKCEIAIKVIPLQGSKEASAKVEEKVIQNLIDNPHPNIIQYFGTFDESGHKYIVMELGQDCFAHYLSENVLKLSIAQFHEIIYQILEILNHLDLMNIFHNDFKFENMVFLNGTIKLIDFDTIIDKESPLYDECGGPSFALNCVSYYLVQIQLEMKCKSKYIQYYKLLNKFTAAFLYENFIDSDAKTLSEDRDLWHEMLPIETRELLCKCFINNKVVRKKIIEDRELITPRDSIAF